MTPKVHAHHLVAKTAVEIANAQFETMASNNTLYTQFKVGREDWSEAQLRGLFVRKWAGRAETLEAARATLAATLHSPIDESLKTQIAEALILDNTLRRGREHQQ